AQTTDRLLASATLQRASNADGGTISAAWLQSFGRDSWLAGVERTEIGSDAWTLARIGTTRPLGARRNLLAQLDIGPANVGGEHFVFRKALLDATVVSGNRWSVRLSDTFADVQPLRGHLLGTAVGWHGEKGLSMEARAARSVAGNLDERTAAFRVDYRGSPPYLMAGVVRTTSNNRLLLNVPGQSSERTVHELFAGVIVPLHGVDVAFVADSARMPELRRGSITVAVTVPFEHRE
ncbi:MAG TPA: hypothetical protein VFJ95_16115, partial [Gammaproteobacteria bacterium]|nr:hypothetical protein [Gammaproteobacteria bacterium]